MAQQKSPPQGHLLHSQDHAKLLAESQWMILDETFKSSEA